MYPPSPPAWIQLATGQMSDHPSSVPSHHAVSAGATLLYYLLETFGSGSNGEEGSWGTPVSGSTASSPQGRNTSVFYPVFLYLSSRYLNLHPYSDNRVTCVLEQQGTFVSLVRTH